ncbi:MAG TPA: Crp/Fnr family transcriptional regulator [Xanthobacteraceae bacterium]|nr:Crp/Fnr family transcriptional regulator [Xanthobacteraceae bacterium]
MADSPLITKLALRDRLTRGERKHLVDLVSEVKVFERGEDIVRDGSRPQTSSLIAEGFCCRYKLLGDGRRQISAIHIAGDFCDLHAFPLKIMDHGVMAITRCRVALVPHARLRTLTETQPHLTRMFWLSTLVDAAAHREWINSLGSRSAAGAMAHLFCELFVRLRAVELADEDGCPLPLTQQDLADALGMSLVHTNRTLRNLRQRGLAHLKDNRLNILSWDGLVKAADFDPAYLHLELEPR